MSAVHLEGDTSCIADPATLVAMLIDAREQLLTTLSLNSLGNQR
jgi:hypothetical protein